MATWLVLMALPIFTIEDPTFWYRIDICRNIYYINPYNLWTSETHAYSGLSTGVMGFHYVGEDYY